MKATELTALIYLWTRDGGMPVDGKTEAYIADTIAAVTRKKPTFSDAARAEMAGRLAAAALKKPERKPVERKKDEAYEVFKAVYVEHRTIAYKAIGADGKEEFSQGDFVRLADLRRRLSLKPGETPAGWETVCRNYCTSDFVTKFSLADLCSRFDVFVRGPLRRNDGINRQLQNIRRGQEPGPAGTERTGRGERTFVRKT